MNYKEILPYLGQGASVYFISIGCAESAEWIDNTMAVSQQYPDFLDRIPSNIHKTVILIDERLETPTYIEKLFKSRYRLNPLHKIQLNNIGGYINFYEYILLIVIKSNELFKINRHEAEDIVSGQTIGFFSDIISHIYDTNSCCVVHTFTGHSLNDLKSHFKGFIQNDQFIWSLTQYVDYGCYVPKNPLSDIIIKTNNSFGFPRLETPFSIDRTQYYHVFNKTPNDNPLKFQIGYAIYHYCHHSKLRPLANFIESMERRLFIGEAIENNYWYNNLGLSSQTKQIFKDLYKTDKRKTIQKLKEKLINRIEKYMVIIPEQHRYLLNRINHLSAFYKSAPQITQEFMEALDIIYGIKKYGELVKW